MNHSKFILLGLASFVSLTSIAQSGQKWATNGNASSTGDFIGTTNNQPLELKSNGQSRIVLQPNGNIIFSDFIGLGNTG
jgi:hypothetical protein